MARYLRVLSPSEAEALKSAQYIKLKSSYQPAAVTVILDDDVIIGATSVPCTSTAATIIAGREFTVAEADPATVYTVAETVVSDGISPFTLTFTPALTTNISQGWSLSGLVDGEDGESSERTVTMVH